jgi:hypothetical protein
LCGRSIGSGTSKAKHADLKESDRQRQELDFADCTGLNADAQKHGAEQQESHQEIEQA